MILQFAQCLQIALLLLYAYTTSAWFGFNPWKLFGAQATNQIVNSSSHAISTQYSIDYDGPRSNCRDPSSWIGLTNLGNTCYANSVFQMLFRAQAAKEFLLANNTRIFTNDNSVAFHVHKLFQTMQTAEIARYNGVPVKPLELLHKLGVNTRIQEDAQEFLLGLLHKIDDSVDKSNRGSMLTDLFRGSSKQVIRALNVDFVKERQQKFLDLSIELNGQSDNLVDAISDLLAPELLEQQYKAGDYGIQDVEKSLELESLPQLMVVTLKRFSFDMNTGVMAKIHLPMSFPTLLDMNNFVNCNGSTSHLLYDLRSIVIHEGTPTAGHYTCIANVNPEPTEEPSWMHFDDHMVRSLDQNEVDDIAIGGKTYSLGFGNMRATASRNAYMLLYERRISET